MARAPLKRRDCSLIEAASEGTTPEKMVERQTKERSFRFMAAPNDRWPEKTRSGYLDTLRCEVAYIPDEVSIGLLYLSACEHTLLDQDVY